MMRRESKIILPKRRPGNAQGNGALNPCKLFKNFASAVAFKQLLNETSRLRAVAMPVRSGQPVFSGAYVCNWRHGNPAPEFFLRYWL
ncbi:hypothetical protein CWO84_08820 [Methylomonas sp. Kb3]|nr:hypothetical protein CWO84_08820 [Methylomonas sp. Kb3]